MNSREFEILKARIQGLASKLDSVMILSSNQEQRSFQDHNTLNRFNEAGITNPIEEDVDANNKNILNIKELTSNELTSESAKFNSLTVGNNIITSPPALVVTKRPHSDQVPTQLGMVEDGTPFYWRSGGNNTLIGNWGSTSLLPAIGTTISKGTTNSFNNQPFNEQADFTFNRAVTAYLGIRVSIEQTTTYDVDLNGWTLVFEEYAGGDRIFKNWGNDLERLFFKIFPAGTYTLDDSFAQYFFKPFTA